MFISYKKKYFLIITNKNYSTINGLKNMKRKTVRICVVDTIYTLWLCLVKNGYNKSDYFIFSTGIPEEIRKNFNHYFFPKTQVEFSKKKDRVMKLDAKSIPTNLNHIYNILKLKFKLSLLTFNKDVTVYGHGHLKYSFPLYKWEDNALFEDGIGNYINIKKPTEFKYPRLARFFGFYFKYFKQGFGTHENIHKIYLTKENYPDLIKDKVEVIDIEELWNFKSDEEKQQILEFFNIANIKDEIKDNCILLLTQPLSDDNKLPLEEELDIYRHFIEKYPNIIIKTHPRENKNYKKLLGDIPVIDTPFPIELIKYMGFSIKKIVTICSTAAINLKDDIDVEIYEKETSSDIINNCIKITKEKLND